MTWTEAITLMSKSPGDAQAVYNPDSQQWTVTQGKWVTTWRRGVRMSKTKGATALGALKQQANNRIRKPQHPGSKEQS